MFGDFVEKFLTAIGITRATLNTRKIFQFKFNPKCAIKMLQYFYNLHRKQKHFNNQKSHIVIHAYTDRQTSHITPYQTEPRIYTVIEKRRRIQAYIHARVDIPPRLNLRNTHTHSHHNSVRRAYARGAALKNETVSNFLIGAHASWPT